MICKFCGATLIAGAIVCTTCAQIQDSGQPDTVKNPSENQLMHWVSIILSGLAFLCFGFVAGVGELNNGFNWIALILSIASIVAAIKYIPKERKVLRIISIVVGIFMTIASIGLILPPVY